MSVCMFSRGGHNDVVENIGWEKAKKKRGNGKSGLCGTLACFCVTAVGKIVVQGEDHHHHTFVCSVERPPLINVCHR